jgi:hypothetical protein
LKVCSKCEKEKPLSDYYKRSDKFGSGIQSHCKQCIRENRALYVLNNYEKIKSLELKRSFGITLKEYNHMFAEQNGCCKICERHATEFKKMLAVDHDHDTGKIRALLCEHCNHGLGKFRDSADLLEKAKQYLIIHKTDSAAKSEVAEIFSVKKG